MSTKSKTEKRNIYQVGFYSALFCAVFAIFFALLLIIGLIFPTEMISFGVCLLLAPCFITMMVSIHYSIENEKRIWSHLGVSFAIVYAVMTTITYYVQLSVVRNNPLALSEEVLKPFVYTNVASVMFAVDMLGYSFMTLSTLVTTPAFPKIGSNIWVRRLFLVHGLLFIPTLIFPLTISAQPVDSSSLIDLFGTLALLFWCVIFITMSLLVMILRFQRTF